MANKSDVRIYLSWHEHSKVSNTYPIIDSPAATRASSGLTFKINVVSSHHVLSWQDIVDVERTVYNTGNDIVSIVL